MRATPARRDYRTADGTRVPGVTTVISRFKPSGGLIHWAWQLGTEGKDYRAQRDAAADSGTLAHAWIDDSIHGRESDFEPAGYSEAQIEAARRALEGFRRWSRGAQLVVVETELALVSEELRVGGTIDALARVHGSLALLDWKTSNRIYADYLVQIAAYAHLLREVRGIKVEELHLVRLSKGNASFHHHSWSAESLEPAVRAFGLMRGLYALDSELGALL